jgi:hypothetical protein
MAHLLNYSKARLKVQKFQISFHGIIKNMNKNSIIVGLILVVAILLFIIFNKDNNKISFPSLNTNTWLNQNYDNQKTIENEDNTKDNNVITKNDTSNIDTKNNTKISNTSIYFEPETDPINFSVGSMGNQYKIMTNSTVPATVTYTLKGSSAAVVPNAVVKDFSYTETVNVPAGLNRLKGFTSVSKPVLTYSVK